MACQPQSATAQIVVKDTIVPEKGATAEKTVAPVAPVVPEPTKEIKPISKTLVIAVASDPGGLDPNKTYTFGMEVIYNIYGNMAMHSFDEKSGIFNPDSSKLVPQIAESWIVAEDKSKITFKINPKATFSNGAFVTADDVIYSWRRSMKNSATQSKAAGIVDPEQYEVIDKTTFVIHFGDKYPPMTRYTLTTLTIPHWTVLNKEFVDSHATTEDPVAAEWLKTNALGAGPYVLVSYKPGEELVLKAREDWWGVPKPFYTDLIYKIVPEAETRLMLLKAGEVDFAYNLAPFQLQSLQSDETVSIMDVPAAQEIVGIRMNPAKPPFDDINIRNAIKKAIPYDDIIAQTVYGYGTRALSPIGITAPGYKEIPGYEQNLEEAKKLIAESKYAKDGVPPFTLIIPNQYPERVAMAVMIQSVLSGIGIPMNIQQLPWAAYWDRCTVGKERYDINIHTMMPVFNDSMYWAFWMFCIGCKTNCVNYENQELYDDTVKSFTASPEEYAKLQEFVFDQTLIGQTIFIPVYQFHWTVAHKKSIGGVNYIPVTAILYNYVHPAVK